MKEREVGRGGGGQKRREEEGERRGGAREGRVGGEEKGPCVWQTHFLKAL